MANAISLAPVAPTELQFRDDDRPADICSRLAGFAIREAKVLGSKRFFELVAVALGRVSAREPTEAAGAELARELARHAREPWVHDGIERGLALFGHCTDETSRRCVANLVAEYFGWREPPDLFFHRIGDVVSRRGAADLVRLSLVTASYARLPKPSLGERRLLAAVPVRAGRCGRERRVTILGFAGDPQHELLRSVTEVPSLGCDDLLTALGAADLGHRPDTTELDVPLVGHPLLWLPAAADHDLRRLHLLLAGAIL
jgi:hypothetical protein